MKLTLKVDMDELNYAELIRAMLPYINHDKLPIPNVVLNAAGSPGVLENFLRFIPQDKQDELVISIFDKNKDKLINKAYSFAEQRGIDVKIDDVTLSQRQCTYQNPPSCTTHAGI